MQADDADFFKRNVCSSMLVLDSAAPGWATTKLRLKDYLVPSRTAPEPRYAEKVPLNKDFGKARVVVIALSHTRLLRRRTKTGSLTRMNICRLRTAVPSFIVASPPTYLPKIQSNIAYLCSPAGKYVASLFPVDFAS
eukprot:s3053_g7.t1